MKSLLSSLLDLIYRKKCYFCRKSEYSSKMCPDCYQKLEFNDFTVNRIVEGVDVYCSGIYTKELQKLIRGLKYHKQIDLAYYQAKFMYEYFTNIKALQDIDFELVPVPLHAKRIKRRKYNHMELVGEKFSELSGFECNFELIKRVKDTKPQYSLSIKQRQENLAGAFQVESSAYKGKTILLLDDICTTGSTFEEMIKALQTQGFKKIVCFATSTPV